MSLLLMSNQQLLVLFNPILFKEYFDHFQQFCNEKRQLMISPFFISASVHNSIVSNLIIISIRSLHLKQMKRLFLNSLRKIMPISELRSCKINQVEEFILKQYEQDITYSKLNRLPSQEVKTMLKIPCPVGTASSQQSQQKIAVFKRIRHSFRISQQSVCFKCQQKCPVRAVKFKDLQKKPKTNNKSALTDLFIYLISLQQADEALYSQLRWSAAYKVTSSLQIMLQDFNILSKQSLLFRQVFKQLDYDQKAFLSFKKKDKKDQSKDIEQKLKSRSIKLQNNPYD